MEKKEEEIVKEQKTKIRKSTIVFIAFLVLLVLFCVFQTRWAPGFAVCVGVIGFAAVAAIASGKITRDRKGENTCRRIGIGSSVLIVMVFLLAISGAIFPSEYHCYDYRESLDSVSSVELIEVTRTGRDEDEFQYRLIKTVPREDWKDVLDQIADLEYYQPFNDPPTWWAGGTGILVRFSPSVDGVDLLLIEESCPVFGREKQLQFLHEACADSDAMNALLEYCGK